LFGELGGRKTIFEFFEKKIKIFQKKFSTKFFYKIFSTKIFKTKFLKIFNKIFQGHFKE
jgi:hypothetical protein